MLIDREKTIQAIKQRYSEMSVKDILWNGVKWVVDIIQEQEEICDEDDRQNKNKGRRTV